MKTSALWLALMASASVPTLALAETVVPAIDERVAQADLPSDTGHASPGMPQDTQASQNQASHIDPDSVPRTMPPPIRPLSPDRKLTHRARVGVSLATRWREHFVRPVMGEDGRLHFSWGSGEPTVVCAPLHWCDVALEPGEIVQQEPNLGDPRWISHLTMSGTGATKTTHLVVKPSDDGLEGNVNIQTNRRSYSIELVSREKEFMPLVAFDYPQSPVQAEADWQHYSEQAGSVGLGGTVTASAGSSPCDQVPSIPPSSYRVGDGQFPWRPSQVYAVSTPVGIKTCVEFPADIGSRSLPSLVALANDGGWFSAPTKQMENLRFVNRRYEVDGELDRFALIEGVGSSQDKVLVTRRSAP